MPLPHSVHYAHTTDRFSSRLLLTPRLRYSVKSVDITPVRFVFRPSLTSRYSGIPPFFRYRPCFPFSPLYYPPSSPFQSAVIAPRTLFRPCRPHLHTLGVVSAAFRYPLSALTAYTRFTTSSIRSHLRFRLPPSNVSATALWSSSKLL